MTTPVAAAIYLCEHQAEYAGRKYAVHNPQNKPIDELPIIYGFNNGGSVGWLSAVAIADDGAVLGGHCCSDEGYMRCDLGILEGTRPDRHTDSYQKHYPGGYRMDFVSYDDLPQHAGINAALAKHQAEAQTKTD